MKVLYLIICIIWLKVEKEFDPRFKISESMSRL